MYAADLVIGAGGTMTREAALFGVPTLTVFAGSPAAVDRKLIEQGLLQRLDRANDLPRVSRREGNPRSIIELEARSAELLDWMVTAL